LKPKNKVAPETPNGPKKEEKRKTEGENYAGEKYFPPGKSPGENEGKTVKNSRLGKTLGPNNRGKLRKPY